MLNKSVKHVLTLVLMLGFMACSDDLEIEPESAVSPDQISAGNIDFFLNGLYRRSVPARDNYILNDTRGGNYTWTALSGNNSNYGVVITGNNVDDRLSYSSSIWNHSYSNIYNANIIIEAADRLSDEADLNRVKAEASYLRAWHYYQLVTSFGGVPLILSNTTEDVPRDPAEQVWAQIHSDLDYAIANADPLSATGSKKTSQEAATALKARVLLAQGEKAEAAELAVSVISSVDRRIDADYGGISSEIIFAFSNLKTETNLRMSSLYWPYGTTWAGSYFVQPSDDVLDNLYEEDDLRKEVNIQTIVNIDGSSNTIVSKYWDVQPLIVTRLSELYLIAAEGLGSTEGLSYLNAIREVRGLEALSSGEIANQEAFLTEVLDERRRELFSEGFLFQDLVRTDRAIDLPNISSRDKYLLPIPGSQIGLSGGILEQNPTY